MVDKAKQKGPDNMTTRISVTFPTPLYRTVEEMAAKKRVSVAWVIRDATEKYVADHWPLLERKR